MILFYFICSYSILNVQRIRRLYIATHAERQWNMYEVNKEDDGDEIKPATGQLTFGSYIKRNYHFHPGN